MNEDLTASIDQAVRAVCEGIARDAGVSPAKLHPSHLTFLTEIYANPPAILGWVLGRI